MTLPGNGTTKTTLAIVAGLLMSVLGWQAKSLWDRVADHGNRIVALETQRAADEQALRDLSADMKRTLSLVAVLADRAKVADRATDGNGGG